MRKAQRNAISLSLVAALFISPATLSAEKVLDSMITNTTPADSWVDASTGVNYLSGGNATYRFNRSTSYAPWVQMRGASGGISCAGASYDLGFIGIMNLDNVEDQLQSAGVTLMWGLLTVFKLSTPNLSAVFEYMNKIIRDIQSMLRNACAAGGKLSSALASKKAGLNDGINLAAPLETALSGLSTKDAQAAKNGSFNDQYDAWVNSIAGHSDDDKNEQTNRLLNSSVNVLRNSGAMNTCLFFINDTVKSFAEGYTAKMPSLSYTPLVTAFGTSKITLEGAQYPWTTPSLTATIAKAKYVLSSELFGDYVLKKEINREFSEKFKVDPATWDATLKSYAEKVNGGSAVFTWLDTLKEPFQLVGNPEITSAQEVVNFLLDGHKATSTINAKNRQIGVLVLPRIANEVMPAASKYTGQYVYFLTEEVDATDISLVFNGFKSGSNKGVRYLVEHHLPDTSTLDVNYHYSGGSGTRVTTADLGDVPVMFAGLNRYTRIIAENIKLKQGATGGAVKLLGKLEKLNAIVASKEVLVESFAAYKELTGNITPTTERATLDTTERKVREAIDILDEKIKAIVGNDRAFEEEFEVLDALNNNKVAISK